MFTTLFKGAYNKGEKGQLFQHKEAYVTCEKNMGAILVSFRNC